MKTEKLEQDLINEGYIDGKKSFDYLHEKIEAQFDFEKVHRVMESLNWEWVSTAGRKVPSVETIKEEAKRLLLSVYTDERGSISCGGLMAGWDNGELWLNFIIEDCHTSDL